MEVKQEEKVKIERNGVDTAVKIEIKEELLDLHDQQHDIKHCLDGSNDLIDIHTNVTQYQQNECDANLYLFETNQLDSKIDIEDVKHNIHKGTSSNQENKQGVPNLLATEYHLKYFEDFGVLPNTGVGWNGRKPPESIFLETY
uniref:Uncharacterized protein LOC114328561 isoform X1 n=1 Tax=Diabrotica virgifera virgifera TaxID=50390 RepID=A0A6P7FC92_DIAVI